MFICENKGPTCKVHLYFFIELTPVFITVMSLLLFSVQERTPFDKWFKVEPFREFHKVVTMEKFMKEIAPKVWPPGKKIGE